MNQSFPIINPNPPNAVPAVVGDGETWTSGLMLIGNAARFGAACKLSQVGSLVLKRFMDAEGTIEYTAQRQTQALTADTLGYVVVSDALPCRAWSIEITNSAGSDGNLSDVLLIQAV